MATEHDEVNASELADLLWTGRKSLPRGRRPGLSLELIVRTAVDLADAEGITFSMQRLASELGAGAMSLYRYVPGKDELVLLMLDAAVGLPEVAEDGTDWRSALEQWAHQGLAVFQRHPWLLSLVTTPRVMGPNETAHVEEGLRALSETDLDPGEMLDTVLLVNGYVRGAAPFAISTHHPDHAPGEPDIINMQQLERYGREDMYPTLTAVLTAADMTRQSKADNHFNYGLQRILDGIEAHINSKRDSRSQVPKQ